MATVIQNNQSTESNVDPRTGNKLRPGATLELPVQSFLKSQDNTVDASRMSDVPTATVPPPVNSTVAQTNLATTVDTAVNTVPTSNQQNTQEVSNNQPMTRASLLDRVVSAISLRSKKGERTSQLNEEEGVFDKKEATTKLEGDIIAKTRAYDKQIEKVRENAGGMFGGAVEQEVARIERQKNSELADLAIQYKIAAGAYNDAISIVQTKLDAEFEPLDNEIQSLSNLYQLFGDDLTESEKMEVEKAIDDKKAARDFEYQKKYADYKAQIDNSDISQGNGNENGTLNGKAQNASQSSANSYANRLAEANVVLDSLGSKFTGIGTAISNLLGGFVPNVLKGGDRQVVEQAQKNFVTAVLRRESGASISPSEFKTAAQIYFPQPGDTKDVIDQKAITRNTVINNFYKESNVARPVLPGQIIESGGKKFKVGPDGETLKPLS